MSWITKFTLAQVKFLFSPVNWFFINIPIWAYKYHQHYFICNFLDYFEILLASTFEVRFSQLRIYSETISQCFLIKWNSHLLKQTYWKSPDVACSVSKLGVFNITYYHNFLLSETFFSLKTKLLSALQMAVESNDYNFNWLEINFLILTL